MIYQSFIFPIMLTMRPFIVCNNLRSAFADWKVGQAWVKEYLNLTNWSLVFLNIYYRWKKLTSNIGSRLYRFFFVSYILSWELTFKMGKIILSQLVELLTVWNMNLQNCFAIYQEMIESENRVTIEYSSNDHPESPLIKISVCFWLNIRKIIIFVINKKFSTKIFLQGRCFLAW